MIGTERLLLRRWRESDRAAHRAIVVHPLVMKTLGGPPPEAASAEVVGRQNGVADKTGSCFWAVEERASGAMIGWCGIKPGPAGTPIADAPEAGWTLHPDWWGTGLAYEAASAVFARYWADTPAPHIYAITTPGNRASWGLMERLGMSRVAGGEFDHPNLEPGDPLRRHCTYRIARP